MITEKDKINYRQLSKRKAVKYFNIDVMYAISQDDLSTIDYLLTSPELENHAYLYTNNGGLFLEAVAKENFPILKYLCQLAVSFPHPDRKKIFNRVLHAACDIGHFSIIQYLLTDPDVKQYINIHSKKDKALLNACEFGSLEIVQYLLTSPDLKEHAYLHAQDDGPFVQACKFGHLPIVEYLLTDKHINPGFLHQYKMAFNYPFSYFKQMISYFFDSHHEHVLNNYINLHTHHDFAFKKLVEFKYDHIIDYLIFNCHIEQTKTIQSIISTSPDIEKKFQQRDFYFQLETTLHSPEYSENKKIKRNKI